MTTKTGIVFSAMAEEASTQARRKGTVKARVCTWAKAKVLKVRGTVGEASLPTRNPCSQACSFPTSSSVWFFNQDHSFNSNSQGRGPTSLRFGFAQLAEISTPGTTAAAMNATPLINMYMFNAGGGIRNALAKELPKAAAM